MLRVEENYAFGIPQSSVPGFAPRSLAWHWTAGGTGRAGAESVIRHFQNTRYTVNASYHILFWVEHSPNHSGCTTYAMWIVPVTKASHSMNPGKAFVPKTGSAVEKARFVEVHRILARDSDPNADSISLSYCGMPTGLAADARCPVFRADIRELARQLIAHPAVIDRPHYGHGWIQPSTRYELDTTSGGSDLLIAPVLYAQEDDMAYAWVANIKRTEPAFVTFREETAYREQPDLTKASEPRWFPGRTFRRLVIGTVEGVNVEGKGTTWLVLQTAAGRLNVAHSQDEVQGSRKPLVEEGETAGIPLASYTALALQAAGLMDEAAKGLTNSAAVVRAKRP